MRLCWLTCSTVSFCVLLTFFLLSPAPAFAVIGFQPISQEELKMTGEPKAPGAPAIILYRQVDRDDNGHTSHEDNYYRIKILKEEGRKRANVEIEFFRNFAQVVNIKGRTIHPDGTIINFDGKVYESTVVKAKGYKFLAKTFTLPDVQVGSVIEYSYTVTFEEERLFESHWILSQELFTRYAKFSLKPYSHPNSRLHVRWMWSKLPNGTEPPKQEANGALHMEARDIPSIQIEDFMPPRAELSARVNFVYSTDLLEIEKDETKYWKNVAKENAEDLEHFIGKRGLLEATVNQIVSPTDSPEQKAQKIYSKVQSLRNTSFEIERTEEEKKRDKEKDAVKADDILKRGYGTDDQLTWLYLGLVRVAGIDAEGVLVSDRKNYFFDPKMMDRRQITTNLVLLHFKSGDIYCDPGAAFTPFGMLPWAETNVQGLRLRKGGVDWIQTPLPDSKLSRIERKANLKFSAETGELEGKVIVTYTGLSALQARVEERNEDAAARKKFLEDGLKNAIPVAADIDLANQPDWKSSDPTLVAEFNVKFSGWGSRAGRRVLFPLGLFSAEEKHLFDHEERVHPIYYEYPNEKWDEANVELPDGWKVEGGPPVQDQNYQIVMYFSQVDGKGGSLHITRKIGADFCVRPVSDYQALRNFYRLVRTNDEAQIVLSVGLLSGAK